MTKMAIVIGIVAVVLVGAFLLAGFNARSSFAHGGRRFMDCMVDKFADKLKLRADQKEELMLIAEEVKNKRQEMRALRTAAKEELIGELHKEFIDKEILDSLYSDVKSRLDEMYDLFSARFVEFHQSLTPEQREKLVAVMEKHHERHRGFHHRWQDEE